MIEMFDILWIKSRHLEIIEFLKGKMEEELKAVDIIERLNTQKGHQSKAKSTKKLAIVGHQVHGAVTPPRKEESPRSNHSKEVVEK